MKKKKAVERKDYCPFMTRDCVKCTFYWEEDCILKKAYVIRSEDNG